MTDERQAMTLERDLQAHVSGMQCAIDNCGISQKEWDAAAKYAMNNIGEWKRLLSDYAQHLSRAAEPVYQVQIITDEKWGKNEWREVTYSEFMDAKGRPFRATRILYTHPPGPARDAPEVYLRNDMLNLDIADSVENQFSIMVRRDGLISYAAYFHGDRRYGKAKGREFVKAFERWMDNTAMKEGE